MSASKTIECVYEGGVFRPLEKVELQEGTRLNIKMGRCDLSKFYGILGRASAERLAELQDHAWVKLIQFAVSKAAKAGKVVELVDARYTSQKCSQCGIMVPKTLADRTHLCPNCGLEMDRDINASLNIRTLGLRGRAYQDPTPTLCKPSKQVRSMT